MNMNERPRQGSQKRESWKQSHRQCVTNPATFLQEIFPTKRLAPANVMAGQPTPPN